MKLSSKVLAGSLAAAGMVLGSFAPVVAQAATTGGTIDDSGNVQPAAKGTKASDLADADHNVVANPDVLAIAYNTGTDATTDQPATATSNANVKVVSGVLVLNAVPDFGFGTAAAGSSVKLADNNAKGEGVDGNKAGLLQVTDARVDMGTNKTAGFNLSATMGKFKKMAADGTVDQTEFTGNDGFKLTLAPQDINDADGNNISLDKTTPITTNAGTSVDKTGVVLQSNGTDSQDIMSPAAGTYNVGQLSSVFSDPSSAKLFVPSDVATGDATKPSAQSYTSEITWTLTANPLSTKG